jgi:LacI family transcriptional regulator, fructose operon transcriptional repressor
MAGSNRKTTIYDIARLSGSSPSTVSAVLSGKSGVRRIKDATREMIERIAAEAGYSPNMQARGLRRARSGLIGMIIPLHENRFFSSLSQSFDTQARERGLVPVIASTLRSPEEEKRVVGTLVSYAIESLIICGATDPDALGAMCDAARLPHVFVDLPGKNAPSVVTNNYAGAHLLTRKILARMPRVKHKARGKPYFLGGSARDYATARRIEAFRAACREAGAPAEPEQVLACGYAPHKVAVALERLHKRLGGLPAALFINSMNPLEGAMSHFVKLPAEAFKESAIGAFDYDPFASYLEFPLDMVRQNTAGLIAAAYDLLESKTTEPVIVEVDPDLVEPRTLYRGPMSNLG